MKVTEVKVVDRNTPCSINYFVPHGIPKLKKKWIEGKEFYEAKTNYGKRIVTPVKILKSQDETIYLMDAITGSLYDIDTGRCLTSNVLHMEDFVFKRGLDKKLLSIRAEETT